MRIVVLGSGSKGNATYLEYEDTHILIDAGLSNKQIKCRLKQAGIDDFFLDGILVTHEHTDHTNGLGVLLNNTNSNLYMTEKTKNSLSARTYDMIRGKPIFFIKPYEEFAIGQLTIKPIPLFHDARECIGFIVKAKDQKVVYITDTGYIHKDVKPLIVDADVYIMEANHDPAMLMESSRPMELKQRIIGDYGHLSNQDAAVNLCYAIGKKTKTIVFAHRSQECNDLEVLRSTIKTIFAEFSVDYDSYNVVYAEQDIPTKIIEV